MARSIDKATQRAREHGFADGDVVARIREKLIAAALTEAAGASSLRPFDVALCGVCGGQSGGLHLCAAVMPGVPIRIAWCSRCLERRALPAYVFDFEFLVMAGSDVTDVPEWLRACQTWADGNYTTFDAYVQRFTDSAMPPANTKEATDTAGSAPHTDRPPG